MQAIARWTRLPETTFVFPADSDDASYRIRMFRPSKMDQSDEFNSLRPLF